MSTHSPTRASKSTSTIWVLALAVLAVPVVMVLASYELKAVYALGGVLVLVVIARLMRTDIVDAVRDSRAWWAARPPAKARAGRRSSGLGLALVAVAGAGTAFVAAQLGTKGLAAAAGLAVVVALLVFVRDKTVFFTFATVASLAFVLHKSLGPKDLTLSGGAISVYVTSFDVLVVLLYALWIREGTFVTDVRAAARRPLLWLPLVGLALLLPSLLVAPSLTHSAAELARMGWMFLLYAYVAIRVRTRSQVWAILAGLGVIGVIEIVVVVLQWRTGGVLGLSFLGVPTSLGERTTDSEIIGRPFGTMIHPVFMAAALGVITMVALALAIELKRSLVKYAAVGVMLACLACMWISQTRASFVAVVGAGGVVVLIALARKRLLWRTIGKIAIGLALASAVFWSKIIDKLSANFGTGHFNEEVASRIELNDIAFKIFGDHPLLGVGLNNFEVVLPRYEANPVIFYGHPVHNLYLLYLAETGIIGLIGVIVIGVALYDAAIRLGRSRDRLLGGIGIGAAGAMGFLMVEELLGFSLRQDIPLALYWLMAGLVVSCSAMAGISWPRERATASSRPTGPTERTGPTGGNRRRVAAVAMTSIALIAATAVMPAGFSAAKPAAAAAAAKPGLTFTAVDREAKVQGIYVANADGTNYRRITPADGRNYNWPRFAFGNTKIVYTVRKGPTGSSEDIAIMNVDGSSPQVLRNFKYRVAQPVIDPTGKFVTFTARAPWFPVVALYRMNLTTGETVNLTGVTAPGGGFDADPFLTVDGKYLAFVQNNEKSGANIVRMDPDGRNRQILTDNKYFNTDPVITPNRKYMAIASFRGEGPPTTGTTVDDFSSVRAQDWYVVVQKTYGGRASEVVLTRGALCVARTTDNPCSIAEMSGYVPQFTLDGLGVSFTGALDNKTTCICYSSMDGRVTKPILASQKLAINWHTWPQPAGLPTSTKHIGTAKTPGRLLIIRTAYKVPNQLVIASPDQMEQKIIPLPDGLSPTEARWGADGKTIVFTAPITVGNRTAPHPAAPPGQKRRTHITLADLDAKSINQRAAAAAKLDPDIAKSQVFLRTPDGKVKQLTDPWIEDWRDGVPDGDSRGNTRPRLSPDGKAVVVTNTSTLTGESFLLRIDLKTGAVLSLTNGTAGAMPTDDADAAFSPDGSRIAFAWSQANLRGIYTMNAKTGKTVKPMTADKVSAYMPNWSANGKLVTYMSARKEGISVVRAAVDKNHKAGTATLVSKGRVPAFVPVISPDSKKIVFVAKVGKSFGIYTASTTATTSSAGQPAPIHSVLSLDWR
ncbi:MAG TPA: O-antigen ligase family protein [Propionibacteriaceae bacterium]